jgi:hypothetical protein
VAIAALAVWEIRTTGNDTNGGAFVTGAAGTDYSQQDAANAGASDKSTTDAVANGTTTITSATANFGTTIVGNVIYLQGGTGSLAATRRQVTARASTTSITVDASVAAGTGITMNIGGALASPGECGRNLASGNTIWIKAGTYTVTSASTNISSGCFSKTTQDLYAEGYQTTRGDLGTRPLIKADGVITAFTLWAMGSNDGYVNNINFDGNSRTTSNGATSSGAAMVNCNFLNCTNTGFSGGTRSWIYNCYATGCGTQAAISSNGVVVNCVATGNTSTGFTSPGTLSNVVFLNCLSYNNTGASSDGFAFVSGESNACINCTSYGNGRDGFRNLSTGALYLNCIAEGNTGTGFNTSGTPAGNRYLNCATYNNAAGFSLGAGVGNVNIGNITGSASFFTNAAGADFSLNNTAGGGALLLGTGLPGALPVGGTGYMDIGALQSSAGVAGGGGATSVPFTG